MTSTHNHIPVDRPARTRLQVFSEEFLADVVITTIIVWGLVLLGEPLLHVLRSPLFIILTAAGLIHLGAKVHRHDPSGGRP
ncbi:MAG: hypothetical protein GY708_05535 [Actinomycetia bacterium]|nr:hypothetical protein [Actinomycetes bacterium]MCP4960321.1 hypothetical protein [Actinomycetes bacterium]